MEPLSARVALDVEQVRVQRFLANAQTLPLLKGGREFSLQWAVVCSGEERARVCQLDFVVLLDRVDLALCDYRVGENRVVVPAREHFILANELKVLF